MNTKVDQGVCSALISLPADCQSVQNANRAARACCIQLFWWTIKAGCVHERTELLAPSNNANPYICLLLSKRSTISDQVNYSSYGTGLYYSGDLHQPKPLVISSQWRSCAQFWFQKVQKSLETGLYLETCLHSPIHSAESQAKRTYAFCCVSKLCSCFDFIPQCKDQRVQHRQGVDM